jgi:TetR/AcrR family transcriptional repressor of lmrAB and yxaGH operons
MPSTRDEIIDATRDLIAAQGYHATALSQIVRHSGAPKGSLYYYFPGGKEELTAEAIERAGDEVRQRIVDTLDAAEDAAEGVARFVHAVAYHLEASEFKAGGPLTTVAMETATTSERLNRACRAAYAGWIAAFCARLEGEGVPPDRAEELASAIIAAIEGGIILSRTFHRTEPLRRVADELVRLVAEALGT